jgi:hypothetical protein
MVRPRRLRTLLRSYCRTTTDGWSPSSDVRVEPCWTVVLAPPWSPERAEAIPGGGIEMAKSPSSFMAHRELAGARPEPTTRQVSVPGPAGESAIAAVEMQPVRAWDALVLGKRSRLSPVGARPEHRATPTTPTREPPVTHAMQVDPRSARSRSTMASCTAAGCTWTVRGVPDVAAAERAFARAHGGS